jgi:hypothetical protein
MKTAAQASFSIVKIIAGLNGDGRDGVDAAGGAWISTFRLATIADACSRRLSPCCITSEYRGRTATRVPSLTARMRNTSTTARGLAGLAAAHLVLDALMSDGLTFRTQPLEGVSCWTLMHASLLTMLPCTACEDCTGKCAAGPHSSPVLILRAVAGHCRPRQRRALAALPDGASWGRFGWPRARHPTGGHGGTTMPVPLACALGEPAREGSGESVSSVPGVLALTETAALSCWKGQELRLGALSVNEVVRHAVPLRTHRSARPGSPPHTVFCSSSKRRWQRTGSDWMSVERASASSRRWTCCTRRWTSMVTSLVSFCVRAPVSPC